MNNIVKMNNQNDILPKHISKYTCINCEHDHKFSPFNVTLTKKIVPKAPVLIKSNGYFIVTVVTEFDKYNHITTDMINNNIVFNNTHGLFWNDGLDLFLNNGLIKLLVNNMKLINETTLNALTKTIYCDKWWEDFLVTSANEKTIATSEEYFRIIRKNFEKYNFDKFNAKLRSLREVIRKEKLIVQDKEREQYLKQQREKFQKQKEAEDRIREENERKREEDEIKILEEAEKNSQKIKSHSELCKLKLSIKRKDGNIEFIASINPNSDLLADMVSKLGEVSKLQIGVNSLHNDKHIKIYIRYLEQQQKLKLGIKLKKAKWSNQKKELELPEDENVLIELNKVQKMKIENIYNEYLKNKCSVKSNDNNTFVLDDWQKEAIENIQKNRNCLITGPTSGGKTYVMMKALDNIINTTNKNIVYISPTFHLAYQTYANVKATFPTKSVAIITFELICVPKNASIFIGTATDILNYIECINYFDKNKINFNIGIFDEIHVASTQYCDKDNKNDILRALAYSKLLAKCEDQVIAASATIGNEIEMCKYIINQMNKCRKNSNYLTINDIKIIKYNNRVIPLSEYRYVDNLNIVPIKRDEKKQNTNTNTNTINAPNLFKLLVKMRNNDMIPSIVFDTTDDIAWETYVNFISYLEKEEEKDYKYYNTMIERINTNIKKFNKEYDSIIADIPENDNFDGSRKNGNSKRESGLRSIKSLRVKTMDYIIADAKTIFIKSIENTNINETTIGNIIELKDISNKVFKNIVKIFDIERDQSVNKQILIDKYPDFKISYAHLDMIDVINNLESIEPEQAEMITLLDNSKGSYYRFSKLSCGMDFLKAIREPGSNEENWKHRKKMILLAEAQHINPKDIDGIIDVIMRGLEFGIAIINPSLPFVIQNIVLENLRIKNMGVVFASESMSMGINFPLRSVIIKSNHINSNISILPGKMIQMAGRCGRRGQDNQAHVIYWGINNDYESHHTCIPDLSYPDNFLIDDNKTNSSYNDSIMEFALELENIRQTKYFKDESKIPKEKKEKEKDKVKLVKKRGAVCYTVSYNNYNKVDEDDERTTTLCENRANKYIPKRNIYLDPIIKYACSKLKYSTEEINEITDMISKIDDNIILDSYFIDSFQKSRHINNLMHLIIELYNFYAMSSHNEFLDFIKNIIEILQVTEYRLIKLAK